MQTSSRINSCRKPLFSAHILSRMAKCMVIDMGHLLYSQYRATRFAWNSPAKAQISGSVILKTRINPLIRVLLHLSSPSLLYLARSSPTVGDDCPFQMSRKSVCLLVDIQNRRDRAVIQAVFIDGHLIVIHFISGGDFLQIH